jgi:predicted hydrocarbon binding protein
MANIFKRDIPLSVFTWDCLGDIEAGRGDLGTEMPVLVYRLMQFTMLDTLTKEYGLVKTEQIFRDAGFLAGKEFAKNVLNLDVDLNTFAANLASTLADLKIGILRLEAIDPSSGNMVLTVGQDLDCSGLPITNENVCVYDEGFIAGLLNAYSGKDYIVREIDCWANGDRVCRFNANLE